MKRSLLQQLIEWKNNKKAKPLLIRGARQVGKTWLMQEFGREEFSKVAYVNFDNNEKIKQLFSTTYDTKQLLAGLQIETKVEITPQDTLIIFDEIQECPLALNSLKYFYENTPEYRIVAAGSLLGAALHSAVSFPVGKIEFMDLYPLTFLEFLEANKRQDLVALLKEGNWQLIEVFKATYIEMLKQYFFVGGMPEAVVTFVDNGDYNAVRRVQNNLLLAYEQDFSKHIPYIFVPRVQMVWDNLPSQLAKENKKYFYGAIRSGARAKEYEIALQWLTGCGLVHRVNRITKPHVPLSSYQDKAFKLYMNDVGLLSAKSGLDVRSLLLGNEIFSEFKGALTEQYVVQQLLASANISPFYWVNENGVAEVDFIFQDNTEIIPLEVKAGENLKSKSLKSYINKYSCQTALRSSLSDYRKGDIITNIPLYAIGLVNELLERQR